MHKLIFFLLGIISTATSAQTSVYKVSKGNNTIYIGGTVHLLRPTDYPLPMGFEEAYKNADLLVFETNTAQLQDPAIIKKMMTQGMFQDERTLKTILADTTYEKLGAAFKKYNLPFEMLQKMKPALAVTTLSAMGMQQLGMSAQGVDIYYANKAQEDNKEVQQLESIDDQIQRLTTMADGHENEFVNYSLIDLENMEMAMLALLEDWKVGRSEKMDEEIVNMKANFPDTYQSLLVDRNKNWMPQILSYLATNTKAFVLVGSLHLYGPDGLLTILEKQGFQIEQL